MQDGIADQFGDLRDYGVSEAVQAVNPVGKPISHSHHSGLNRPYISLGVGGVDSATTTGKSLMIPLRLSKYARLREYCLWSDAFRVGHNPDTFSKLMQSSEGCAQTLPLRIIPDFGQGSENSRKPSMKQRCDVLHDNELRSKLANEARVLIPKAAALTGQACTFSACTDVLAGEPPADNVNFNCVGAQTLRGKGANIVIDQSVRPTISKMFAALRQHIAKGNGFKTAGAFKPKAETADAAEQIEDAQLVHLRPRLMARPIHIASGMAMAKYRAVAPSMMRAVCIGQAASPWVGRVRDALAASSSNVAWPSVETVSHISAGMLSRWSHERTVVSGRPVSAAITS